MVSLLPEVKKDLPELLRRSGVPSGFLYFSESSL
jgi:hypothetical protein